MATFDIEYIGAQTRQLRLGELVIKAQTRRRNTRPELTIARANTVLWGSRVDLFDQDARLKIRLTLKRKHQIDVPEQALLALAAEPDPQVAPPADPANAYRATPTGFVYRSVKNGSVHERQLSNFTAVIQKELLLDDGDEIVREYELRVVLNSVVSRIRVPATQLGNGQWVAVHLGARAILYAGNGSGEHLRAAIQHNSPAPVEERIHTCTGWRVHDGKPVYLHAAGALDATGLRTDIRVQLPAALARYALPDPPQGPDLAEAVRASLRFLEIAPDRVTVPMLSAVYRAVMGRCDTTVHLVGQTGVYKTELAALVQQHFGREMDARKLPVSWESTATYVAGLQFSAKDALLVVDDFVPTGTIHDVQRSTRDAARVVRGQGNASARGRARPDGSLREIKPPRGLILSTGEDVPAGHSLKARMLLLDVAPGDVNIGWLTACQQDARNGVYACALGAVIKWLAANPGKVERLSERVEELRARLSPSVRSHARTPHMVADLMAGLEVLLAFATDTGILSGNEAGALMSGRVWPALLEAAARQAGHQRADDPATRFIELLRASLTSGRAHVTTMSGAAPADCRTWGWQTEVDHQFTNGNWQPVDRARPQGRHIGWIHGQDLYLQPDASLHAAQEAAGNGPRIAVSPRTLHSRLKEKGILASVDDARGTATIRKVIDGNRQEVLHLKVATIFEPDSPFGSSGSVSGSGVAYP